MGAVAGGADTVERIGAGCEGASVDTGKESPSLSFAILATL